MCIRDRDDFVKVKEDQKKSNPAAGGGWSRKERKAAEREHRARHAQAWLDVLLQTIRTLVLSRITPKSFKTLPGLPAEAAANAAKDAPLLGGSNIYSVPEQLLLRWLEAHWRKVNPLTFDKPDKQPGDVSRVAVYDKELRDGHALAAAILSLSLIHI